MRSHIYIHGTGTGHTRSRALVAKLQNQADLRDSALPDIVASAGITF